MSTYAFHFNGTRCTGCKTCEMACKDYKDLRVGIAYRSVYEVTLGETKKDDKGFTTTCVSYPLSMACNHCDNPACVHVCPTGAMHRDQDSQLVVVDPATCIGCGYCDMACPYNAPTVDKEKGHSVKCDGCIERIKSGGKPVCVEACPARALDFGTIEKMSPLGERGNIAPLPKPTHTTPNFFIKPSEDARLTGDKDARVANPLEVK